MKQKMASHAPLLWLLCIPVLNVFYGILNREGPHVRSLMTGLDEAIPFVSVFIVPYLIWYPFMIGMFVYLFKKSSAVYYRALIQLCIGLVVCYITYYLYQTVVSRPIITDQVPLHQLVSFVYSSDQPFNCFPSIHVMTTYVILKHTSPYIDVKRFVRLGIHLTGWSIIVSTVFVKQHVVLDIAGAILLVECMYYLVNKFVPLAKKAPVPVSALEGAEKLSGM
jgi:membrane-associated phospholipid phosphatase